MTDDYFVMHFMDGAPLPGPHPYDPNNLHVTFLAYLHMEPEDNKGLEALHEGLKEISSVLTEFELKLGPVKMFGLNNNIPVRACEESSRAAELHVLMLQLAQKNGFLLSQQQFTDENFKPHVTFNASNNRYVTGDEFTVNSFTLVRHQNGLGNGPVQVVDSYPLRSFSSTFAEFF